MPRQTRVAIGGLIYHVINRANGRERIFKTDNDYVHFESLMLEAVELIGMRVLSYCIMPNHWHIVLYPKNDSDLSKFMMWLTTTHVRQTRVKTNSVGSGHIYQGSYKSFPIENDNHLLTVIRYVEQNPLRAKLVNKSEEWRWSSLFRRTRGNKEDKKILSQLPTELPSNYLQSVNTVLRNDDLEAIRYSVKKGKPFGSDKWVGKMVDRFNLTSTLRGVGRPRDNITPHI
ncbi:MAG: transposase [Candidatus Taylorbacteria bacterium]|nr:transposase [Candidatus Taylorbacteria bacterium]